MSKFGFNFAILLACILLTNTFNFGNEVDRRAWISLAVKGIGVTVAAMVGVPALVAGFAPLWTARSKDKEEIWTSIGLLDQFPVGVMKEVIITLPEQNWGNSLQKRTIYAWRPSFDEAIVYSRACTDLGCPLNYDYGSECFFCPCHGGIFNKNGERMAGPPSRPMYRFKSKIVKEDILIELRSIPPMA